MLFNKCCKRRDMKVLLLYTRIGDIIKESDLLTEHSVYSPPNNCT